MTADDIKEVVDGASIVEPEAPLPLRREIKQITMKIHAVIPNHGTFLLCLHELSVCLIWQAAEAVDVGGARLIFFLGFCSLVLCYLGRYVFFGPFDATTAID